MKTRDKISYIIQWLVLQESMELCPYWIRLSKLENKPIESFSNGRFLLYKNFSIKKHSDFCSLCCEITGVNVLKACPCEILSKKTIFKKINDWCDSKKLTLF